MFAPNRSDFAFALMTAAGGFQDSEVIHNDAAPAKSTVPSHSARNKWKIFQAHEDHSSTQA
jgi:hypothetical protein